MSQMMVASRAGPDKKQHSTWGPPNAEALLRRGLAWPLTLEGREAPDVIISAWFAGMLPHL